MEGSVMAKQIEWEKVAELADKIREQGLSLAEGAKQFGMPVWRLYELSRRKKHVPDNGREDGGQSSTDMKAVLLPRVWLMTARAAGVSRRPVPARCTRWTSAMSERAAGAYLVVIVDDYSRFCVGAELCGDQKRETLLGLLHEACNRHGKPGKLLTDIKQQ